MKSNDAIPTIDLDHPHRPLLGRVVEACARPGKIVLDSLPHAGELDATTRGHAEFLLSCIEESAELNRLGQLMTMSLVKEILRNHHQVNTRLARESFPPVEDPVVILGLPRTGSSYLFNLLGSTRCFRTLRHWETHKPASRTPSAIKRLESACMLKMMHHLMPGFRTVHEIRLDGPEECTKPLMNCFVSQAFPGIYHIPRYNEFLDTADYLPTYAFFHKALQIVGSNQKRWLLKSPIHMQSIDSLLTTFPGARFVHLHRDFEEVLGSICSLTAAYRCLTSNRVDGREIGSEVRKYLSRDLAKGQAVLDAHRERVMDVHYKEIVEDPVRTVERVLAFVGCERDAGVDQALRREMQVSVANKYGRHVYRSEDYFPDDDEIAATRA